MREVVLRVPEVAVEDVLDRLLPMVPGGVREVVRGRQVDLCMRGPNIPPLAVIKSVAGRWPHRLQEREVSDDWRARRLADYEQHVIGGRLVVRPDWAPTPRARDGLIDVVLSESAAFGAGTHPTTGTCLELLLELPPAGSFADLGCGTGVLAIVAAKLGWAPIIAVDLLPESVAATLANAGASQVKVMAWLADLSAEPPPVADGLAANVPAGLHVLIATGLGRSGPRVALISGFAPSDAPEVIEAYAARGLRERRLVERHGWAVAQLERD